MSFEKAQVKFNGGRGALLCNGCDVIIATGIKHEDKYHYCEKCSTKSNATKSATKNISN